MDTAPRQQVATAAPREQGRRQALHVGTVAWLTFAREKHLNYHDASGSPASTSPPRLSRWTPSRTGSRRGSNCTA